MGAQAVLDEAVLDEAHVEEEVDFDDVSKSRTISTSWMIGEPMSFLSDVTDVKSEVDIELPLSLSDNDMALSDKGATKSTRLAKL